MPDSNLQRRIAISGAGGLIGRRLSQTLEARGDSVVPLVRPASGRQGISWDPKGPELDPAALAGIDAVVHLAGEPIDGFWSEAKKQRIMESRRWGTWSIAQAVAGCEPAPRLICASAVGFYGDRGDTVLDESSSKGEGFLADVCELWEEAVEPMAEKGLPTAHLRFGVVLSQDGGALAQLLTPFKLGLGGRVGSGKQWMSWIHREDAVAVICRALDNPDLNGPVNVVAPNPARNVDFTKSLGRALHRPTWIPVPSVAVRLALGDMGKELLLASTRVIPKRLLASGFEFRFPTLDGALDDLLS